MLKKTFLFIFIGGIFYLFGAVTVQYKLFPFSEIVKPGLCIRKSA